MLPFPVQSVETPLLRQLEIMPAQSRGQMLLIVRDPLDVMPGAAALVADPLLMVLLQGMDGKRSVAELTQAAQLRFGVAVTEEMVRDVIGQLDEALMFYSPKFAEAYEARRAAYRNEPVRKMIAFRGEDRLQMIKDLGEEFRRHLKGADAPPPKLDLGGSRLLGLLCPHIDYARGGHAYAWGYKAIREHSSPKTFIILGTVHRPTNQRFIATPKNFETPFGEVATDTELLKEIETLYGLDLYEEEYMHAQETTIELQVVYLKQLYGDREFKIVPILVGAFEDILADGQVPAADESIPKFIAALRTVLEKHGEDVVLIGGVDFSHCGPQFGQEQLNEPERVVEVEHSDREMLAKIEAVDPDGFFESFRTDMNARNVCSIAPIYVFLEAMKGHARGRTLIYQQANSDDKACMVSFASVAFTDGAEERPKSRIVLL